MDNGHAPRHPEQRITPKIVAVPTPSRRPLNYAVAATTMATVCLWLFPDYLQTRGDFGVSVARIFLALTWVSGVAAIICAAIQWIHRYRATWIIVAMICFTAVLAGLETSAMTHAQSKQYSETKPPPDAASSPSADHAPLPEDIDLRYLTGLYRGRTQIQADRLASDYIGKWMFISLKVINVESVYEEDLSGRREEVMVFVGPQWVMGLDFLVGMPHAFLTFSEDWIPRVAPLREGSPVKALCQINYITSRFVAFKHCELR